MTTRRVLNGEAELPPPPALREANFYALSFASQMIVWATRKELRSLVAHRAGGDEVLSVFHLADWGAIYASVLAVVEILATSGDAGRLQCHAVSCPRLAPHEVSLLNALTHLQQRQPVDAALHLCESLHADSARPLLPHLERIAIELRAHGASTDLVASVPGHFGEAVTAVSAAIH